MIKTLLLIGFLLIFFSSQSGFPHSMKQGKITIIDRRPCKNAQKNQNRGLPEILANLLVFCKCLHFWFLHFQTITLWQAQKDLIKSHKNTQGVLALKFPISILMQIRGQHRCQMFHKIVSNYVTISDFATRQLNLRKPMQIVIKGALFQCNFCASLIFGLQKICFWPKMSHRNEPN